MLILRLAGGTCVTSRPPMVTVPVVTVSNLAIIRSRVDLPQPDGPSKAQNSPCLISRSGS